MVRSVRCHGFGREYMLMKERTTDMDVRKGGFKGIALRKKSTNKKKEGEQK